MRFAPVLLLSVSVGLILTQTNTDKNFCFLVRHGNYTRVYVVSPVKKTRRTKSKTGHEV